MIGWCLWGLVVAALAWQTRQALREPLERDLRVAAARRRAALLNEVRHDVGPDALRLLEDLDAHLDQYFARLSHLFEELGPPISPDPMAHLDAGCDRLLQALREHREDNDR